MILKSNCLCYPLKRKECYLRLWIPKTYGHPHTVLDSGKREENSVANLFYKEAGKWKCKNPNFHHNQWLLTISISMSQFNPWERRSRRVLALGLHHLCWQLHHQVLHHHYHHQHHHHHQYHHQHCRCTPYWYVIIITITINFILLLIMMMISDMEDMEGGELEIIKKEKYAGWILNVRF